MNHGWHGYTRIKDQEETKSKKDREQAVPGPVAGLSLLVFLGYPCLSVLQTLKSFAAGEAFAYPAGL
jgi:hypothetical protein